MKNKFFSTLIPNLVVFLSMIVVLSVQAQERRAKPAPKTLPGAKTEIYKNVGGVELPIHIYEPEGHGAGAGKPAIVFFFGGGWRSGSPGQFEHHCRYLASRGMVAMTAEYRVSSRHGVKAVSCFKDAKSAIRWVRRNAKRLGVDPEKVAAGGGSAGGHLAGALGAIDEFDEAGEDASVSAVPAALVLFNPALIVAPVKGERDPFEAGRMAGIGERMGVEPERLSPYHHVDRGVPPTLILHGRGDTTVPYFTAELFARKMKAKGNRCELEGYDGEPHGFFNWGRKGNGNFIATVERMDAFLVSLGYLEGKGDVEAYAAKAGRK